jgi:hypothetical protein
VLWVWPLYLCCTCIFKWAVGGRVLSNAVKAIAFVLSKHLILHPKVEYRNLLTAG